jgi:CBS domain-containing protein
MKVSELMTRTVASCRSETNLASAGALMWESDCGILPVIDDRKRVIAVLTDRDVCIALTTRDRRASAMTVGEVVTGRAFVCDQDDDVRAVLKIMQSRRIHRLPVVNKVGLLEGIVSLNDIALRAEKADNKKPPQISFDDVVTALQAICSQKSGKKPGTGLAMDGRTAAAA